MGRIRDAVRTLLEPSWDAQLRADRAEYRSMTAELNNLLEKLNTWAAREAKRRVRATRQALDDASEDEQQQVQQQPQLVPNWTRAEWKAALMRGDPRARAMNAPQTGSTR